MHWTYFEKYALFPLLFKLIEKFRDENLAKESQPLDDYVTQTRHKISLKHWVDDYVTHKDCKNQIWHISIHSIMLCNKFETDPAQSLIINTLLKRNSLQTEQKTIMKLKSRNPSSLPNVCILIEHSIHSYLWKLKLRFADWW
jgi:hypothetical protein